MDMTRRLNGLGETVFLAVGPNGFFEARCDSQNAV